MAHEKVYSPVSEVTGVPGEVVSWSVSRELSGVGPWAVSGVGVGSGQVVLLDDGSPWKPPLLAPGAAVTVNARSDSDRAFSRIATMVAPDFSGSALTFEKSFTIQDDMRALLAPMQMPAQIPAAPVDAAQAIVLVCEKAGVPHDVQTTGILVPALIFEATTGWDAIQEVAEKTLGAAWMSETGTVVYRNAATMRGVGAAVESIVSLDSVEDVAWTFSDENVADRCTVTYTPFVTKTVTNNSLTLWESQSTIEIAAGATVVIEQDFEGAAGSLAPWKQAQDESAPADQFSRWNAAYSVDGGDAPPASVLTVTSTLLSASRVRITLKSNATKTLFIADFGYQSLILRANKTILPGAAVTLEAGNTEETARNTASLDVGLFAGSEAKAKELLGWLAQQSATPRGQLEGLRVVPDPARRLGSIVQFTDPITGVSSKCVITAKTDSGSAGTLDQHLTLTMVPGTTPGPVDAAGKITVPVGTSSGSTLAERQAFRDANADRTDKTIPPAPSAGILTARLGVITVGFDGKTNTASDMPPRVQYVQVALSSAPTANAVVDTIPAVGGQALIADQPYNSERYIRMRAISYAGIPSPWGAERSIVVKSLVDTDLIGKVLGSANIKDGAVTEVTIAQSAITAAKIAVDAITADKLLDGAVLSGKIADAAITGAKLAQAAVDATKLAPGAVTDAALAGPVKSAITGAQAAADNAQSAATAAQGTATAAQSAASAAASAAATADAAAAAANQAALDAAGIAGSKGKVLVQSAAPGAADRNAATLWIDTTGGNNTPKRWSSGTTWVAVTDKAATDAAAAAATADGKAVSAKNAADAAQGTATAAGAAAAAAQASATAAQGAADAAQSAATAAQTTANGKAKVTRATTDATGAGANGDQWWKYAGSQIVGLWIHNGTSWVAQTLTDAVITNLDAGTITAGFLAAARIQAATITGTHIAGGTITASNMVAGTITAASAILADAVITNAKIADLAVSGAKIADATITNAKISSIDAVKINAGTLNAARIAAESITAEKLAANSVTTAKILAGAVTAAEIAALSIEAGHIKANAVTTDKINAGSITAAKIAAGVMQTEVIKVMSSDHAPGVPAVRIDGQGVRTFDLEGGERVKITGTGDDFFTITNSAGDTVATLDSTGGAAFGDLAVAGEARIDGSLITGGDPLPGHGSGLLGPTHDGRDLFGRTFLDYIDDHPNIGTAAEWLSVVPHGIVLNTAKSDPGLAWDGIGGQAHYRVRLGGTVDLVSGRLYLINYSTPAIKSMNLSGPGGMGESRIITSPNGGTINVGGGSSVLPGSGLYYPNLVGWQSGTKMVLARCPEDIPAGRIMLGIEMNANPNNKMEAAGNATAATWQLSVVDLGVRRADFNGNALYLEKQGTAAPTPPPTPVPPEKKQYVTYWNESWSGSYRSSGAINGGMSGKVAQGYSAYASGQGVMRGLVGFPSVVATLSGADIVKVEVYVYAAHWHSNAGGTLCIGGHTHATKPTTWSSNLNDAIRQKLKKPEGRWITLPSSMHAGFKSGLYKGISLLPPGSSTSSAYYGYLTGGKQKLRITYKK